MHASYFPLWGAHRKVRVDDKPHFSRDRQLFGMYMLKYVLNGLLLYDYVPEAAATNPLPEHVGVKNLSQMPPTNAYSRHEGGQRCLPNLNFDGK